MEDNYFFNSENSIGSFLFFHVFRDRFIFVIFFRIGRFLSRLSVFANYAH